MLPMSFRLASTMTSSPRDCACTITWLMAVMPGGPSSSKNAACTFTTGTQRRDHVAHTVAESRIGVGLSSERLIAGASALRPANAPARIEPNAHRVSGSHDSSRPIDRQNVPRPESPHDVIVSIFRSIGRIINVSEPRENRRRTPGTVKIERSC